MKKFTLTLFVTLLMGIQAVLAQDIRVTGTVRDGSGAPMPGVTVIVDGTTRGASTATDGSYTINAPANGSLQFSFIGMNTVLIPVNNRTLIDVVLETDAKLIDDVIVVAYGTARKESFTGSAAVIGSEKLAVRTVSNVTKALDGLVPGVVTTSGGGQPGRGSSIRIRGTGSINASNEPLFVVDGAPYTGDISSINPADIESMTVLKDASAGALYGSRGANGVIVVTTRRGDKTGRSNINFRANVGVVSRSTKEYETLNQREFVETTYAALKNQYLYNSGYTAENAASTAMAEMNSSLGGQQYNPFKNYTWQTLIDPTTGKVKADAVSAWDESWTDELTNSSAMRQEYSLSVNGGNERTTYVVSGGYLNEDGWLKHTDFERFSVRTGVTHQVKSWMSIGANLSYAYLTENGTQYSGSQTGNVWYTAQFMAPIYPMYRKDAAGNDVLDANGERLLDYGNEDGTTRPKGARFNALGDLRDNKNRYNHDLINYAGHVTFGTDDDSAGALKGLKLAINVNGDVSNTRRLTYYNMYHGDAAESNGQIYRYHTRVGSYTFNQLLTYNRDFGRHSISALVGHEYYEMEYNRLWAEKTNLYDGILELAPGVTVQDGSSFSDYDRVESYLGRINYGFDNKYYFDVSFRRDGSSRFHKDNRWGNFWSVGASWRVSQEEFMKSVLWLDNLTFKASYGSQGNNNLLRPSTESRDEKRIPNYYAWESYYSLTWPNANYAGAMVTSLENKALSWEKQYMFNTGIEASLLHNRMQVSLEFYHRKTTDLLLEFPMAMSTGFTGYNANVGEMTNHGFELSVGGLIADRPDFTWYATLMGYTNKNEVKKLTDTDQIIDGVRVIEVGKPIYTYYMAKSAGVDPATGDQLYWAYTDKDGKIMPEYITADKSIAAMSKYYQGDRAPDFQGSFGSNFTFFKSFDLSFLTTFSIGGKVYDSVYAATMQPTYIGDTFNKHILRAWSQPGDITDIPRPEFNAGYTTTDRWLVNASYFAIKNISVGYTLPQRLSQKLDLRSVRVFCTFDNIAIFSHLDGMDPSYNFTGGTDYSYAPLRTMSIGLDINF